MIAGATGGGTGGGVTKYVTGRINVGDGPRAMTVGLTYRRNRPWEIDARFGTADWVFARDLLATGLHQHVGAGDVRVGRCGDVVRVVLRNATESAVVVLPLADVAVFLAATTRLVPFGTEHHHTDLDALCDALTRKAA